MSTHSSPFSPSRRSALLTSSLLLLAPLLSSQEPSAPTAAFEAATIKPSNPEESNHLSKFYPGGRFVATAVSLKNLVLIAYRLQDFQLAGGPKWCES
ncbi:MAG TPA: TIGR03435 family protein, partial [Bryobacteraceae bacterium]|nr:TIGR03435 family protein [Bryobacteraceae bacterium]